MKTLTGAAAALLLAASAHAATAFYVGERQTGLTKQCFYDYAGNGYTITIKSYAICPMTIEV